MQLSSELAGQHYHARSATIALAIILFLSVYQFLSLILSGDQWHSLPFLLASLFQVRALLTIQQAHQTHSYSCLFAVLLTWFALYQTHNVSTTYHLSWFYLISICTYFFLPLKKAHVVNTICWLTLFVLLWYMQSSYIDLAILISAFTLFLLMNVVLKHIQSLESSMAKLHVTDPVTGCANREALEREMIKAVELNKRYGVITSALALNVQNLDELYKKGSLEELNDALKELIQVWVSRLRNTDLLCRYSDNQFICLLPNTELNNALLLSDDLLKASESYDFNHLESIQLGISVAESNRDEDAKIWLHRTLSK